MFHLCVYCQEKTEPSHLIGLLQVRQGPALTNTSFVSLYKADISVVQFHITVTFLIN